MSSYNFMRGRQMIIHDPRLDNPLTTPRSQLRPPDAMNAWTVSLADSAVHILKWAATVARGGTGNDRLDGLHFIGHGGVGGMQMGLDGFGWQNLDKFLMLKGCIRGAIVFFSCQVGGEQAYNNPDYQLTFGGGVAAYCDCKVVVCKMNQFYSWGNSSQIDFGEFEGVVYVYQPRGGAQVWNYSKRSKINLENVIFP